MENITRCDFAYARIRHLLFSTADMLVTEKSIQYMCRHNALLWLARRIIALSLRNGKLRKITKLSSNRFWLDEKFQKDMMRVMKWPLRVSGKTVGITYKGASLRFVYNSNVQLANTRYLLVRQFIDGKYADVDVKGRQVLDIGASVGDTAIFFVLNGAKKVYAYEPFPYSYEIAKRNIRINHMEGMIELFNEGCGGRSGYVQIPAEEENYLGSDLKKWEKGRKVRIKTLKQIVAEKGIRHGVLKMNCEGCEYGIILNTDAATLRRFDIIRISYHYGYLNLVEKLRRDGFTVAYSRPRYFLSEEKEKQDMYSGHIFAYLK